MRRTTEFVHRNGLRLAVVLYAFVIAVVTMCGVLLKVSV